ncbi:IclR family transcriptional regulator [Raineyella sp.]|uniref:IclR family transcriptional regulator n=1 Tax=Raineyella sp. TaxID=1911550 RepID=UPI002B1F5BAA|nr:IclR family transcriptional regulator [Raineyella sp.]MEA5155313.1 IclR family transcriptional regulator [Raineyella sp.]
MAQPVAEPVAGRDILTLLDKVALILSTFDDDTWQQSLTELTARSGLAKATVHRLAGEMVGVGLLEKTGIHYRLGLRLFELGQLVPRQRTLREVGRPYVRKLMTFSQETVHLALRDGLDVIYVDKLEGDRGLQDVSRVAGRLPAHATATGKVLLAHSNRTVLEALAFRGLTPLTRRTTSSFAVLRRQLDRIRADGFAREVEETRLGYMSIAVPVHHGERDVVAALSVTGTVQRLSPAQSRLIPQLRQAAAAISADLVARAE